MTPALRSALADLEAVYRDLPRQRAQRCSRCRRVPQDERDPDPLEVLAGAVRVVVDALRRVEGV